MPGRIGDDEYAGWKRLMDSGQVGSPNWESGKTRLTIANLEIQGDLTEQLVASTKELLKATDVLAKLTIALVALTVALVVVAVIPLFKN
jgi:hypothetical protein